MSKRGKLLECPFTWKIDEKLSINYNEDIELSVPVDDQPAIALMNTSMMIYNSTIKGNYDEAKTKIAEVVELQGTININRLKNENISSKVLNHIVNSVIYHVHEITGDKTKANEIFDRISDAVDFNRSTIDIATMHGCKAIAWSSFHECGHEQALIHAQRAVEFFNDCPLWHYLLYKNYRRAERVEVQGAIPSEKTRQAIFECTRLSIHPFYLIHVAEMYRESYDYNLASIVYEMVYDARPTSTGILLRLGYGFMKYWRMDIAKECFDRVELKSPNNPMYLQYRGLYLRDQKKYEEAANYFKAAAAVGMYVADLQYASCRMKSDKSFDPIEYLKEMLERYPNMNEKQNILLHIAMQYRTKNEFPEACHYFIEAIRIDRQSQCLKTFKNRLSLASKTRKKIHNIFVSVNNLLRDCKKVDPAVIEELRELCKTS